MNIASKLLMASAIALTIATPALAQDYYAPTNGKTNAAPQADQSRSGDYYAPTNDKTSTAPPSALTQEGDFYAPENGKMTPPKANDAGLN